LRNIEEYSLKSQRKAFITSSTGAKIVNAVLSVKPTINCKSRKEAITE
jgi:hypothetical protein